MRKKIMIGIAVALVVVSMATAVTATAMAQGADETTQPETRTPFWGCGNGFGRGMDPVGLEAAAETLGMTADELSTQLWGGNTLADLADAAGVDLADIQEAMQVAHQESLRDSIEQAVEDGSLTRSHADWLLEGLDNGYWGGRGPGVGVGGFGRFGDLGGHGMRGMRGGFESPSNFGPFQRGTGSLSGASGA